MSSGAPPCRIGRQGWEALRLPPSDPPCALKFSVPNFHRLPPQNGHGGACGGKLCLYFLAMTQAPIIGANPASCSSGAPGAALEISSATMKPATSGSKVSIARRCATRSSCCLRPNRSMLGSIALHPCACHVPIHVHAMIVQKPAIYPHHSRASRTLANPTRCSKASSTPSTTQAP
jgi:hypothetical protein